MCQERAFICGEEERPANENDNNDLEAAVEINADEEIGRRGRQLDS